jgi:hypothetical protein
VNHRAAAEHLLDLAATERDAAWAQVFAARALAHATLAGPVAPAHSAPVVVNVPLRSSSSEQVWPEPPRVWCSTDRELLDEPIIAFQGEKVQWRTAGGRGYEA